MQATKINHGGDRADQEPFLARMLDQRRRRIAVGDYHPVSIDALSSSLTELFRANGMPTARAAEIRRMAGGASKEQFVFTLLDDARNQSERLVLRMDPTDGVLETSRVRECEVIRAVVGHVPVPQIRFLDPDGSSLGAPGMVSTFIPGVTKPTQSESGVSGLGPRFSPEWRARLAPQFIDYLAKLHELQIGKNTFVHYGVPDAHPFQAALWRVNHWSRVWREDAIEPMPIMSVVEHWLRDNLPRCERTVLLHGDFRTGNYLFDESTGRITALLDWELSHIGDFHEDLAWSLVEIFGTRDTDGRYLCSGLMTLDDMLARYEARTGRAVDRKTLRFYHILLSWSVVAMASATGLGAAAAHHNHQDILLTWISMVTPSLIDELTRLLTQEDLT